jgi:ligand-binding sensor domain-containing protein
MKQFFLYIIILFLSFSCFGQEDEPLHFQFTVEDGLPSNRIYDIMQDSKGYLWLGTDNGLVRFNGKEFKEFSTTESTNLEYSYLHELKDGSIWCINFGNQVFKISGDSLLWHDAFKPFVNDKKYFKLHEWKDSVLYLENKDP